MRSTRSAVAIAVLAVVGLVVSLLAAWPQLSTGSTIRVEEPGPAASAVSPLAAPPVQQRAQRVVLGRKKAPDVSRSDATALRKITRQARTPRPVRARLGAVGIDAVVRPVGVRPDGQMQLPADPEVLGWYRFGAAPGAEDGGATVIAGHLDSKRFGLGPLVRLRDVRVADTFRVVTADGTAQKYVVKAVRRYDRQRLPAELFSRTGPERLHLITCGGAFDTDDGYELNLVVTAVPVT